jgi:cellulose synthase/poly-beta-1,6-N-acetylglucosamine synthase-like glycosyltransferase
MWLLLAFAAASVAMAACVCAYHIVLMAVAAFCRVGARGCTGASSHSFAIVIPANDEESNILRTLDSCAALDYPESKRAVYVIADNCSDRTADLAKGRGVECLIRHDEEKQGKGFALAWAFPKVLAAGHDAVVVLDADCRIDPHALLAFDERLSRGNRVLQASDVVGNPDDNATCYTLATANVLENYCFYAPKSALGLAVPLRGTGMVFHRDVLLRFPWRAESIVEDAEYTCQLLEAGERVCFVPEARVISDFPVSREQLAVQRGRWIGGGLRMAVVRGPSLLWQGLRTGRLVLIDAALTMLLASRPLVIGQFLASLGLAVSCWWLLLPGPWPASLVVACASIAAAYTLYAAVGIALLGIRPKRIRLLLQLPLIAAAYLFMAMKGLARGHATTWNRTPRAVRLDPIATAPVKE